MTDSMTDSMSQPASLDAIELAGVTGGGVLGAAWKVAKKGYQIAKPHARNAAPFGYIGYKLHGIWHRHERAQQG